jgi:hypothetical protein
MEIKFTQSCIVGDEVVERGTVRDVSQDTADAYVDAGVAEEHVPEEDAQARKVDAAVAKAKADAATEYDAAVKKAVTAAKKAAGPDKADAVEKAIVGILTPKQGAGA